MSMICMCTYVIAAHVKAATAFHRSTAALLLDNSPPDWAHPYFCFFIQLIQTRMP